MLSRRKGPEMMTRENMRLLLYVAEWTVQNHRQVRSTIRELAGSEENYLIIARELDRVNAHIARARSLHAEASLTLVEWLIIVDTYHWKCAYCQEEPFEVMHHRIPLHEGGTIPPTVFLHVVVAVRAGRRILLIRILILVNAEE